MSAARSWSTEAVALGCVVGCVVGIGLGVLWAPDAAGPPRARRRERAPSACASADDQPEDRAGRAEEVMEGEGGRSGQ